MAQDKNVQQEVSAQLEAMREMMKALQAENAKLKNQLESDKAEAEKLREKNKVRSAHANERKAQIVAWAEGNGFVETEEFKATVLQALKLKGYKVELLND